METEEQFKSRVRAEYIANGTYKQGDPDLEVQVNAAWENYLAASEETTEAYKWLDQFPSGYMPPPRISDVGPDRVSRMTGQPNMSRYVGTGLVNSRGLLSRNADGSVKKYYDAQDVQSVWRGIAYTQKKELAEYMKAFGIYGGGKPSLNLDQVEDFNAFARVLYTANGEGRTWDVALETLAKRYQDSPKKLGSAYKPTSIADIKRVIQKQATDILGRGLTPQEAKPLAQRIQQQETRQQTMASGQQPTSTSTLIEQGVQKDFAPEAQAFNFARFAQSALGYAGSSAGAQPDVELETMGGM